MANEHGQVEAPVAQAPVADPTPAPVPGLSENTKIVDAVQKHLDAFADIETPDTPVAEVTAEEPAAEPSAQAPAEEPVAETAENPVAEPAAPAAATTTASAPVVPSSSTCWAASQI